jgi:hypothetical protein
MTQAAAVAVDTWAALMQVHTCMMHDNITSLSLLHAF